LDRPARDSRWQEAVARLAACSRGFIRQRFAVFSLLMTGFACSNRPPQHRCRSIVQAKSNVVVVLRLSVIEIEIAAECSGVGVFAGAAIKGRHRKCARGKRGPLALKQTS
jgi:hypothetical protein